MFNLTVESVRGCVTDGVDLDNPEGDMTCDQMMWGAWTGCKSLSYFNIPVFRVTVDANTK